MEAKKTVQELKAYPVPLFDEEGYLKLDSNESDFGPSPKVLEVLRSVEYSDIQYYPFYGKLLEKLAKAHGVKIENVILTAGADEAISSILGTFLDTGDGVLTVKPSFIMPKIYAKIGGLDYKEIHYEKKWEFPAEKFLQNIDKKTDLIHLTTPNAPTGDVIPKELVGKIVEKAAGRAVLIDETYGNYCGFSNLGLIKENDNVFVVRSFSKDYALAGLRLGYIISDSKNIKELRKYLSPFNVSNLTVKAGIAAIDDAKYFEAVRVEVEKSKKILKEGLEKIGAIVYPSVTNFICADLGEKAEDVYNKLLKSKIKVKLLDGDPLLENTLRIAIPRRENSLRVLEALGVKLEVKIKKYTKKGLIKALF